MAEDFSEFRRNVTTFMVSLRNSIERSFRGRAPKPETRRDVFMRTMMIIEEARIRFNTYARYVDELKADEWFDVREGLLSFVNKFFHSEIDPGTLDRRFVLMPLMSRDRDNPTKFMRDLMPSKDEPIFIGDAMLLFREYLEQVDVKFLPTQVAISFEELGRIVPQQQVAPVQFDISNGRIVVAPHRPVTVEADRENIHSALEHIRGSGEQLITNLENSNCDKRLLDSVKELQAQLVSDGNIVKIGLTNLACGVMGAQFQSELPDAVVAMFTSHSASVSLYVAQFPEWEQFTQKAVAVALDEDDVTEVDAAAAEVIEALTENPLLADPEVPKTIAFVRELMSSPGISAKRAAFAMIRTIENLVSSILRHTVDFFSKTTERTVEIGSIAASKVIIGMLGIALLSATGIGQAAVRAGAPWVKQAAEVVQKQIDKVSE